VRGGVGGVFVCFVLFVCFFGALRLRGELSPHQLGGNSC
jgi:hypothetical protein